MAVVNRSPLQRKDVRRIWRTPGSKFNWLFLAVSALILGVVALLYRWAIATQQYPGPDSDPLRDFGITAFVLVILVAAYTLRRRFVRSLPGKVHTWLWLHIWLGCISVIIAAMHDNFQNVTHDFSFMLDRFTEASYGTTALYALFVLVVTGIIGRLLDLWQARLIAREADTNGVGIMRSVEERLLELTLTAERLRAGKSAEFRASYEQVLQAGRQVIEVGTMLSPRESDDFARLSTVLDEYDRLAHSLERQERARQIMRIWRSVHIPLAIAAFAVIAFHSVSELWAMLVLHM